MPWDWLALPLVVAISTSMAARNGILVRDRLAFEAAREIDTVIFDKTGTLTEGQFGVVGITTGGWLERSRRVSADGRVEGSRAYHCGASAGCRGTRSPVAIGVQVRVDQGRGVRASSEGHTLHVGGRGCWKCSSCKRPSRSYGSLNEQAQRAERGLPGARTGKRSLHLPWLMWSP